MENVTSTAKEVLASKAERVISELEPYLREEFVARNALDMEFYGHVAERFTDMGLGAAR